MKLIGLALAIVFMLTGCMSTKSFIDPTYPKVSYEAVTKKTQPLKLNLVVEFQRNGESYPRANPLLKDNAERILRATGVVTPTLGGSDGEMKITVNNIADTAGAAAKGFGTGLSFGLVGTTVTDAYEMSVAITVNGKTVTRSGIKHAFHTAIGNTTIPAGLETIPPDIAFQKVLEQMLLLALQDMQKTGELGWVKITPYLTIPHFS